MGKKVSVLKKVAKPAKKKGSILSAQISEENFKKLKSLSESDYRSVSSFLDIHLSKTLPSLAV